MLQCLMCVFDDGVIDYFVVKGNYVQFFCCGFFGGFDDCDGVIDFFLGWSKYVVQQVNLVWVNQ